MSNKKTLDVYYTDKIQEFDALHKELSSLRERLGVLDSQSDEYAEIKKRTEELESRCDDEIDYYANTASILFNYYNIIENNVEEPAVNNMKDLNKGILKYFMKTPCPSSNVEPSPSADKKSRPSKDKATLLEEYIAFTSSNYVKTMESEGEKESCGACDHCGSLNRVTLINDSLICCNDCHSVEHIIVDHDKPSYKDTPREVTYFSYRRINHLNELSIIFRLFKIYLFWL